MEAVHKIIELHFAINRMDGGVILPQSRRNVLQPEPEDGVAHGHISHALAAERLSVDFGGPHTALRLGSPYTHKAQILISGVGPDGIKKDTLLTKRLLFGG